MRSLFLRFFCIMGLLVKMAVKPILRLLLIIAGPVQEYLLELIEMCKISSRIES